MSKKAIVHQLRNKEITVEDAEEKLVQDGLHQLGYLDVNDLVTPTYSTGFPTLDSYAPLRRHGDLIILGARPSMGKSSLLLQMASRIARENNVLFVSLEMSAKALETRLLGILGDIPLWQLRAGRVNRAALQTASNNLRGLKMPIFFDTKANATEICNRALQLHKVAPLSLVVVDYLQIVLSHGSNRADEVKNATQAFKDLAAKLGAPVLVSAQLNREVVQKGKDNPELYKPDLSHIAECDKVGAIADIVMMLSREEFYNQRRPGEADVGIVKNRDGRTGWEILRWNGEKTKFSDPSSEGL